MEGKSVPDKVKEQRGSQHGWTRVSDRGLLDVKSEEQQCPGIMSHCKDSEGGGAIAGF